MLIQDFANLPENRSGFWVEKLYSSLGEVSYLVYHQGFTELRDSIFDAKQRLKHRNTLANVDSDKYRKEMYCFPYSFFG